MRASRTNRAQGAEVSPPEASAICSIASGKSCLSATSRPMCESWAR